MLIKADFNQDRALRALRAFPEQVNKQMRLATKISLRDIQVGAQQDHRFVTRGGMADKSIVTQANSNGLGGTVSLDTGIAPYAPFLHGGTGIHGPSGKAFPIQARNGKALRFVAGGRFVFRRRVMNPGIKGDPFLYRSANREEPKITARFEAGISTAIQEGGLK